MRLTRLAPGVGVGGVTSGCGGGEGGVAMTVDVAVEATCPALLEQADEALISTRQTSAAIPFCRRATSLTAGSYDGREPCTLALVKGHRRSGSRGSPDPLSVYAGSGHTSAPAEGPRR